MEVPVHSKLFMNMINFSPIVSNKKQLKQKALIYNISQNL